MYKYTGNVFRLLWNISFLWLVLWTALLKFRKRKFSNSNRDAKCWNNCTHEWKITNIFFVINPSFNSNIWKSFSTLQTRVRFRMHALTKNIKPTKTNCTNWFSKYPSHPMTPLASNNRRKINYSRCLTGNLPIWDVTTIVTTANIWITSVSMGTVVWVIHLVEKEVIWLVDNTVYTASGRQGNHPGTNFLHFVQAPGNPCCSLHLKIDRVIAI